jgi:hypothetical protein
MITSTTEEDQTVNADIGFSLIGKSWRAYCGWRAGWAAHIKLKSARRLEKKARLAVEKSNKLYSEIEEMKYYLTQRHRMAVAAWHSSPEVKRINKAFFTALDAVAAIESSNQTVEQKAVLQRIALKRGKREIKAIVAGRVCPEN